MNNKNHYHPKEERINVVSHFIGLQLSVLALIALAIKSVYLANVWYIVSFIVYGISMVILYLASTLYHNSKNPIARKRLNIFDHAAIYILIAGSYTPYTLVTLHGTTGWLLFGLTWGVAIAGVIFKLFYTGRFDKLSTILYVAMGWMVIIAIKPLINSLAPEGLFWLALGGVLYTIGAVLYSREKLNYNHAIFHIFVLLGSFSHFISIYFYV
jgi:hemolysin III